MSFYPEINRQGNLQAQSSLNQQDNTSYLWSLAIKVKNFIVSIFSYLFFFSTPSTPSHATSQAFRSNDIPPSQPNIPTSSSYSQNNDPKIQDIIDTHKNGDGSLGCCGLTQLQAFSGNKDYNAIHSHHYDWWMFPIDRSSTGKGEKFRLSDRHFTALSQNSAFLKDYVEGIRIVLDAWGWDLKNKRDISNGSQRWDGYGIRLAKTANSLQLIIRNSKTPAVRKELENVYQSVQLFYRNIVLLDPNSCSDFDLVKKYCEN